MVVKRLKNGKDLKMTFSSFNPTHFFVVNKCLLLHDVGLSSRHIRQEGYHGVGLAVCICPLYYLKGPLGMRHFQCCQF